MNSEDIDSLNSTLLALKRLQKTFEAFTASKERLILANLETLYLETLRGEEDPQSYVSELDSLRGELSYVLSKSVPRLNLCRELEDRSTLERVLQLGALKRREASDLVIKSLTRFENEWNSPQPVEEDSPSVSVQSPDLQALNKALQGVCGGIQKTQACRQLNENLATASSDVHAHIHRINLCSGPQEERTPSPTT